MLVRHIQRVIRKYIVLGKYAKQIHEEQTKKLNWDQLFNKMSSLNMNPIEQDLIKKDILRKESENMREKFL